MNVDLRGARILIADDEWANINVLESSLLMKDYSNIRTTIYSREVISIVHELEQAKKLLEEKIAAVQEQNKTLKEIAWIQSHVVRAPLARMMSAISLFDLEDQFKIDYKEISTLILDSANELDNIVREITEKSNKAHLLEDLNQ